MNCLKVLVADDNTLNLQYLEAQIERFGHTVVGAASSGLDAVRLAKEELPDLVIIDVIMPELDGIKAAEQINEDRKTPIIFLSAFAPDELDRRAPQVDGYIYLTKPVGGAELKAAITSLCEEGN